VGRLLKGKRVTQFSFSYDVLDGSPAQGEEFGDYYELRKLKLYEVGPCLIGVNQETELLAAKALADFGRELASEVKSGRVLSAKNEGMLREARDAIDSVLATLDSSSDDGKGKAEPKSEPGSIVDQLRDDVRQFTDTLTKAHLLAIAAEAPAQ
jgi:hypothetical protein